MTLAGSVYCADDDAIRENLTLIGPRVVTFNNVLRWRAIPLAEAICELLEAMGQAMSSEVEIEFAVDMGDFGRQVPSDRRPMVPRLYVLQARPMAGVDSGNIDVDFDTVNPTEVVVRTEQSLGNGRIDDIRDIVYVRRTDLLSQETRAAASQLREIDHYLGSHGRRYLLIGPGRFGSSDASLGIPVDWLHICHARVIVEVPLRGEHLDSSQGTHFFHNVTSARLGYLTATPQAKAFVDRDFLDESPAVRETELVRHVELDEPLRVRLDGRHGRALVLKPGRGESNMDETPVSLSGRVIPI